jgi:hypothetical protein
MPERKKLLLRLDPEVYEAIARWAGDDLRSINAQIEFALRAALERAGRPVRPRRPRPGPDPHQPGPAPPEAGPGAPEPGPGAAEPGPAAPESGPAPRPDPGLGDPDGGPP